MATQAAEQALAEIKQLEETKKEILTRRPKEGGAKSREKLQELDAQIEEIDQRIATLQQISEENVSPTDLVQTKSSGKGGSKRAPGNTPTASNKSMSAGDRILDWFIDSYANFYGPMLDTGRIVIPAASPPFINVTFFLEIIAQLRFQINGQNTAKGNGNITAKMQYGLGVGIDKTIMGYGIKLLGGIEGGVEAKVNFDVILRPEDNAMRGWHDELIFDFGVSGQLFLDINVPNSALRALVGFIDDPNLSVRGQTINYTLFRFPLIEARTRTGSFVFVYGGRFTYVSSGNPHVGLSRTATSFFNNLIISIEQGIRNAMERLNPANWDLTPWW